MTDATNPEDDEMLEAIRAAFGDDAMDEIDLSEPDPSLTSLEQLVDQIDSEAAELSETRAERPVVESAQRKYIAVRLGDTTFAIPMDNVYEIQRLPSVTCLPGVPAWVQGVCNLRGNVLSVVHLGQLLGLPTAGYSTASRLVVSQSLVDDVDTGFVVDQVLGIRSYEDSRILPPTAFQDAAIKPYLLGMIEADELVVLLDVDKLMLSEEFRQFDAA